MSLPEQHRRLADVLETLKELDDVRVAETRGGGPAEGPEPFTATVTIAIADKATESVGNSNGSDPQSMFGDEAVPVEADDADDDTDDDADDRDQEESEETAEDESTDTGEEVTCDVEGCDYSGTQRGLSVHQARAHENNDDEDPPSAEEIKAIRDAHGWTQAELADELGVGNSTVANWESQGMTPSPAYAKQLRALQDDSGDGLSTETEADAKQSGSTTDESSDNGLTISDGGVASASSPSRTCQNCGAHVSLEYTKVHAPNPEDGPRVCPACPDKVREHDGSVREVRSTRESARRVDE
jgi:DNA-binding transcriptional regulator YiaG